MKMTNTPPLKEISPLNAYKFILVAISMLTYSIKSNAQVNTFTNVQVTNTMTTNGNAVFNSSVRLSNLSGGNSPAKIMVDQNGFLLKGPEVPTTWECFQNTPNWNIGGNNAFPIIGVPGSTVPYADIGTCDLVDFMLKSHNKHAQWIKPDGSVMFGTGVGSNSGGREYRFNEGVIRLQGMNSYGGPQVIFDGGVNPFGDWGIEYLSSTITAVPGLNFWKPSYSPNSYNYLFFIGDNGIVNVGNVTPTNPARFNVDGWSGNGIKSMVLTNQKAYTAFNKTNTTESFAVYANGNTSMGANNQIGFPSTSILSNSVSLLINNQNINGVRFLSSQSDVRIISALLNDNGNSVFTVFGDGRTRIGGEFITNSTYMLTVNGKIGAREIKVSILSQWPDYVFKKNYSLTPLENVEKYVQKHEHLPGIPSAEDLQKEELGLDLAQMQALQLEKIENIYLYLFEMKKELADLKKENAELRDKIKN